MINDSNLVVIMDFLLVIFQITADFIESMQFYLEFNFLLLGGMKGNPT